MGQGFDRPAALILSPLAPHEEFPLRVEIAPASFHAHPMFPFSTDLKKYTEISSKDANARRELIDENYNFCIPLNRDQLPESLQKIPTLVSAFVSGVKAGTQSPVGSGKMLEVVYTVRHHAKDAPETGNANAYLYLQIGPKFYQSPPCDKLGDIPHHFRGKIPFELHVDPKEARELPEQTQAQQPEQ
jgi:hypothetical protein